MSGGDISSIAPMLAQLAGNYASAAQYQFDPNGQAYKPNMQAGIQFGAAGVIPEIYKYLKDQKQRGSYVASATPGNYQQGGPIDSQRVKPRTMRIEGMTRADQTAANVPSATTYANPLEQLSMFGLPPQPAPMNMVYPAPLPEIRGGSSKSKSKDRYREHATGGYINTANVKSFDKEKLKAVQLDLQSKGLYKGRIDGIFGPKTNSAIEAYNFRFNNKVLPQAVVKTTSKQTDQQLAENKSHGDFPGTYLMVNDKENTMHVVSKNHEIMKTMPAITGKNAGEGSTAPSSREWIANNPDKNFHDYIDYLEEAKQKITPTGLFFVGKKDYDPSAPQSKKGKLKQALYDYGLTDNPDYNIRPKRYENYGDALMTLKDVNGKGIDKAIHGTGKASRLNALANEDANKKLSAGCVNVDGINYCMKNVQAGAPVVMMSDDGKSIVNTAAVNGTGSKALASRAYGGKLDEDGNPNDADDKQLSNSAFQVKGNPNVTDGNSYPELNANLDHNEVVKNNFVFSNKLKMPNGISFAEAARKLEISTGKAEKNLKSNPDDPFARATVAHNEKRSNALATQQETLATAKGLRGPSRNFANGGPTDPKPNQPYIALGNDYYYDPYNNRYLKRGLTGAYTEDPNPGATSMMGGKYNN